MLETAPTNLDDLTNVAIETCKTYQSLDISLENIWLTMRAVIHIYCTVMSDTEEKCHAVIDALTGTV